jgi:hypothetical protein
MRPHIIAADGTITIMVDSTEYTVAPKDRNYNEILWCIENEIWEPIPELLTESEEVPVVDTDFSIQETMTRAEAIEIVDESLKESRALVEALKEVGADVNWSADVSTLSNEELKEALDGIGVKVQRVID